MTWRNRASLAAAPLLGLLCIVAPALERPEAKAWSFLALVQHAIEGFGASAALLLFILGVALGTVSAVRSVILGLAAIASLPLISIVQMVLDPSANNLGPIAWFFYWVEWAPVFAGAELSRRYLRWRRLAPP